MATKFAPKFLYSTEMKGSGAMNQPRLFVPGYPSIALSVSPPPMFQAPPVFQESGRHS
jgi:hypothetical protein